MTSHGSVTIKLHKGQREVIDDNRRFKVVVAGRRWGKTQCAKTAIIKRARKPKQLIWYVAPSYKMARQIMWREIIDTIPPKLIIDKNETRMEITLINGTLIALKGADKPDSLRGVGLNFVVIDEAQDIKEDTWYKVLRATLSSTRGDALIIGTPKAFNWLHKLYTYGKRGDIIKNAKGKKIVNNWKSWQFPTIMSPFISPSEIEDAKNDLDEKTFRQEYEASFETMSGRVYYAFERSVHTGRYKFNPKLPIWIGQDFNIDPMSSVIMQPQKNGEIWIVDEVVLYGSNTEETANEIERRYWRYMDNIVFYPDPAGNNRANTRGESNLDILRERGFRRMKYKRRHPAVSDRINAVNRMFKSADGAIRLRVDDSCAETIKSLEETIYKPGSKDVDKRGGTEHQADALGYAMELEFPVKEIKVKGISI